MIVFAGIDARDITHKTNVSVTCISASDFILSVFKLVMKKYFFAKFMWSDTNNKDEDSSNRTVAQELYACSGHRVELSTTTRSSTRERQMGLKHLVSLGSDRETSWSP